MSARDWLARLVAGPALAALRAELGAQRAAAEASSRAIDDLRAAIDEGRRELSEARAVEARAARATDELGERIDRRDTAIDQLLAKVESLRLDQRAAERRGEWQAEAQRQTLAALAERIEALRRRPDQSEPSRQSEPR